MPSYILCFSYLNFKNKMAAKICENVTTLHHCLAYNEHKKHYFGVLKPTWATYLKSPEFHPVRLPLEDEIQNGRHCKAMCHNFASKLRRDVFLMSTYRFLTPGKPIQSRDNIYYQYFTWGKNKCCARKTTHRSPV